LINAAKAFKHGRVKTYGMSDSADYAFFIFGAAILQGLY